MAPTPGSRSPSCRPGMDEVFTYRKGGKNEFLRSEEKWMPTPVGLHSIGGVIEHLNALTAIGASTVNSYRRLNDLGLWAPVYADWGFQNRTVALRVSAPGRIEYRAVDAAVNPYLMSGALLRAFDDGLKRKLSPGEPEQRNVYEAKEAGKQLRKIPMDLGTAFQALAKDDVVRSALPGDMYRVFMHLKRDEWELFNATVTEWDFERFLEAIS